MSIGTKWSIEVTNLPLFGQRPRPPVPPPPPPPPPQPHQEAIKIMPSTPQLLSPAPLLKLNEASNQPALFGFSSASHLPCLKTYGAGTQLPLLNKRQVVEQWNSATCPPHFKVKRTGHLVHHHPSLAPGGFAPLVPPLGLPLILSFLSAIECVCNYCHSTLNFLFFCFRYLEASKYFLPSPFVPLIFPVSAQEPSIFEIKSWHFQKSIFSDCSCFDLNIWMKWGNILLWICPLTLKINRLNK